MGRDDGHDIYERIAVLETKLMAVQADIEDLSEVKIMNVPIQYWIIIFGVATAMGQGPDILKLFIGFAK